MSNVLFNNFDQPPQTPRAGRVATGSAYVPGIRFFSKYLDRYVELSEIWGLDHDCVRQLWTETRLVVDSVNPHIKPARRRTAKLMAAVCEYNATRPAR